MALSSLRPTSDDWAMEPRSLETGILAVTTLMRDEGRHSAVQVMNVLERDFVLHHGEFIGEAEQVTTVKNEEAASRPSDREEDFSEEATVPTGRPVEESNLEESCDDAYVKVVIDNSSPKLNSD